MVDRATVPAHQKNVALFVAGGKDEMMLHAWLITGDWYVKSVTDKANGDYMLVVLQRN